MAGLVGIRGEDMEQVDALKRAKLEWPQGLPFIRPHVLAPVVVRTDGEDGFVPARFGMSKRFTSFNARDDKLTSSRLWRGMFGKSHAVAALSYVVEWVEEGGKKAPYLIGRRDGGLLLTPALLGPYLDDKSQQGFAICTREPNRFFAHFHGRMVGVLTPQLVDRWLDPAGATPDELLACVRAPRDDELAAWRVTEDITKRKEGNWEPVRAAPEPLTYADLPKRGPAKQKTL
ncbi:MAG TPA: SOS response-associated peptidase family protein [Candidatus Thermoplasmatota archaeon]